MVNLYRIFFKEKPKPQIEVISDLNTSKYNSKDWYVISASQNPLFMLWDVILVNLDDTNKFVISEEQDSYECALNNCICKIEKGDIRNSENK